MREIARTLCRVPSTVSRKFRRDNAIGGLRFSACTRGVWCAARGRQTEGQASPSQPALDGGDVLPGVALVAATDRRHTATYVALQHARLASNHLHRHQRL